jgi:hypothetical protein
VAQYYEHLHGLRQAFVLQPGLFNEELRSSLRVRGAVQDNWSKVLEELRRVSAAHRAPAPTSSIVTIDLHSDGVKLHKDSSKSNNCIPVLARISALVHPETGQRFLLHGMPPFIVNVFIGKEKPLQDTLMEECVEELANLRRTDGNKTETRIFVDTDRIVADGPAATDLTGRKPHMGYYSMPRCKQSGEKLVNPKTGKKTGVLHFPVVECQDMPRCDDEWEAESRSDPKVVKII